MKGKRRLLTFWHPLITHNSPCIIRPLSSTSFIHPFPLSMVIWDHVCVFRLYIYTKRQLVIPIKSKSGLCNGEIRCVQHCPNSIWLVVQESFSSIHSSWTRWIYYFQFVTEHHFRMSGLQFCTDTVPCSGHSAGRVQKGNFTNNSLPHMNYLITQGCPSNLLYSVKIEMLNF